ncbi:sodium-independent anion transporter [Bacillus sp. N9]
MIKGPLFFGTAQALEHSLHSTLQRAPKAIILNMSEVSMIDATGEEKLASFIAGVKKNGGDVLIAGLPEWGIDLFKNSGMYDTLGSSAFFQNEDLAIQSLTNLKQTAGIKPCLFLLALTFNSIMMKVKEMRSLMKNLALFAYTYRKCILFFGLCSFCSLDFSL